MAQLTKLRVSFGLGDLLRFKDQVILIAAKAILTKCSKFQLTKKSFIFLLKRLLYMNLSCSIDG